MNILDELASRFSKILNKTSNKNEFKEMAKKDLALYKRLRTDADRKGYILNNAQALVTKIGTFKNKPDNRYSPSEVKKLTASIATSEKILNRLWSNAKKSFTALLILCLAVGVLCLLTLILMNKNLNKFIRLTSDLFYETARMIQKSFARSMGALLSLSVTDCMEEFMKCTEEYHTAVRKIVKEIKKDNLDKPTAILLASSGLMLVVVSFQYYQLFLG